MTYLFQCFRRGELLWEKQGQNLIVADGLMDCLNQYIGASLYNAGFTMGLKDGGAPDILDTLSIHPNWNELTPYAGPRPPCFFGAWGTGVLGGCLGGPAIFNITAPAPTVQGAFLVSASGKLVGAATTELDSMLPGEVLQVRCSFDWF
jgi:hypothetical protein